ncbi:MAG: M90 family metallopeptidase [Deltaproteobacteria bacterium]
MIWNWLTARRRKHITDEPFPPAWEEILERNVGQWRLLDEEERTHLRALVQVFVAEKHWEGCGGLELTDEIKVTIAAEACVLLLGLDHSLYADVESILVYPSTVVRPDRPPAVFGRSWNPAPGNDALLGEAHLGGPVILAWDSVKRGARDPADGHNLVFHEFAHKIDMLEGSADGTPPLETASERRAWAEVCSEAFLNLKQRRDRGQRDVLDAYGATNEAEFFAVATEAFFERPAQLERGLPELYELLARFYKQDPGGRVGRAKTGKH